MSTFAASPAPKLQVHYYKVRVEASQEWLPAPGEMEENQLMTVYREVDFREELLMEYEILAQRDMWHLGERKPDGTGELMISEFVLGYLRMLKFPFLEKIPSDAASAAYIKRHVTKVMVVWGGDDVTGDGNVEDTTAIPNK